MLKLPPIRVIDRLSKEESVEKVYGLKWLAFLYGNGWLSRSLGKWLLPLVFKNFLLSLLYGWLQGSWITKGKVIPFIKKFGVNPEEFEKNPETFSSFNDFFIRKLKPEARPIAGADLILPADGRYLFFPKIEEPHSFFVKGQRFSLEAFLRSSRLAAQYEGGSMVIGRLCPTDYHRFHFPAAGIPSESMPINGWLASVNPAAVRQNMEIFWENKRCMTHLQTPDMGRMILAEVGALCVGKIHQTYVANTRCSKGEEKGYFAFGGSSLVLLFEPGRVVFDDDLLKASAAGLEVRCLMGQSLGSKKS